MHTQSFLFLPRYITNQALSITPNFQADITLTGISVCASAPVSTSIIHMYILPGKEQGVLPISSLLILTIVLLYLGYRWALPRPIAGIPYDESASRTIFGNLPEIRAYVKKNGRLRPWLSDHPLRHKSPITQFWARPFKKPSIIISDFQESQDLLLRRTKEFDRSQRSVDFFSGIVSNHHIAMRSSDPRFKGNKELVKDLMTPAFLNEVCIVLSSLLLKSKILR